MSNKSFISNDPHRGIPVWHASQTFYLAYRLTFFLAYLLNAFLAFYLAYIQSFFWLNLWRSF